LREWGVTIGVLAVGPLNAITDVEVESKLGTVEALPLDRVRGVLRRPGVLC